MNLETKEIKFEKVKTKWGALATLPRRSTASSAGYDFFSNETVQLMPSQIWLVHTGIKAKFPDDVVLQIFDRSSNPIKRGIVLANSVGIIDSDYYSSPDNDGEIMGQFMNITDKPVAIMQGQKIMQGIFFPYYLTSDDNASGQRVGGFGSTGER